MNKRQALKDREAALLRAQEFLDLSDAEEREFTEGEQAEFDVCVKTAEDLGAKLEKDQENREKVKALVEQKFSSNEPVKPEAGNDPKKMKRADFNLLNPFEQAAFVKAGGAVQD